MSMDTMLEIAECLGISLDYMIWGEGGRRGTAGGFKEFTFLSPKL